jgi:DNA mismatch repair protein MutL
MPQIRILPDRVANQIAAGEVVERPAAVVKELVENALDAGATRIDVEFWEGGRALLRVEDNGHGMARDDALLALERHATSKIADAADLDRLTSFGFRGEALPSIASVARFTLQTRAAGAESGTEVLVNGGKLLHVRDCGRPVGTSIAVEHLFHPVPARRKFLKSDAAEAAQIVQWVRLYALAFPQVAFSLTEDRRTIFRSPECETLADRVAEIFGAALAAAMVPIAAAEAGLRLSGLIGRPGLGRSSRHEMITFVNTRPVESRVLTSALIESYHAALPPGRYPAAFLLIECDPAAVDVNVHPTKREVRFRSEPAVRNFVIRSIQERLRELGAAAAPSGAGPREALWAPAPRPSELALPPARSLAEAPAPPFPDAPRPPATHPLPAPAGAAVADSIAPSAAAVGPSPWRWVGLAHGTYAVFETPAGLILLDRQAAHERIWFERLPAPGGSGAAASQRLLLPIPLELDPIAAALLLDRTEFLAAHGFVVAAFGRNFFRLESVPVWMEPADAEPYVRDLLASFREGRRDAAPLDAARAALARVAAARALRTAVRPDAAEMAQLVADLFATRSPLTSPAGRPTYIEINRSELGRRFQHS